MELKLKVVQCPPESDRTGHVIKIDESGATIGRAVTNMVALPDPNRYVSSLHAKIQFNGEHFEIIDQSTNGTFLNNLNQALEKGQATTVSHGDQILMGPFVLEVEIAGGGNVATGEESTSITNELDDTSSLTIPPSGSEVDVDDLDRWLEPDVKVKKADPPPQKLPETPAAASTSEEDSLLLSLKKELDPLFELGKADSAGKSTDISSDDVAVDRDEPEGEPPVLIDQASPKMGVPDKIPADWDQSVVVANEKQANPEPLNDGAIAPTGQVKTRSAQAASPDNADAPAEPAKDKAADSQAESSPLANGQGFDDVDELESLANQSPDGPDSVSKQPVLPLDPTDSMVDQQLSDWLGRHPREAVAKKPGGQQGKADKASSNDIVSDAEGRIVTNSAGEGFLEPLSGPTSGQFRDLLDAGSRSTGAAHPGAGSESSGASRAVDSSADIAARPVVKRRTTGQANSPTSAVSNDCIARTADKAGVSQVDQQATSVSSDASELMLIRRFAESMGMAGQTDQQLIEALPVIAEFVVMSVDGLMGALRGRQTIKNEFRMNLTMIQPVENNPLKFSLSAEDAIENLFIKRRKAYLSAADSASEAFADIADHQLALFNGIRAAYDQLMNQFSPEHLEKRFERQRGRSLFGGSQKKWDAYCDFVDELNEDQEKTFKHLFGEIFAEQYERSFESLKARRRKQS